MRKEIVAKAILKRLNKTYTQEIILNDSECEKVLGCWLLQPKIAFTDSLTLKMEGSYVINAWVSIENATSTKCIIEKTFFEDVLIKPDNLDEKAEVSIYYSKKPTCDKAWISSNKLHFNVDYSIVVEWIGDTKMYVEVVEDDLDHVIDLSINEEYI